MNNNLRRGTPVFIEWDDSASYAGWRSDTNGMKTGQVKSIGFVFGVNENGVILTASLARVPEPDIVAGLDNVIIPHGCIKRVQIIELKGEKLPVQLEGELVTNEPTEEITVECVNFGDG